MFFARFKTTVRTLRFRLMAWNAVIVILTGLVTLVGVREGVRLEILHEMDQVLIEDVYEIEYKLADAGIKIDDVRHRPSSAANDDTQGILDDLNLKARGHEQHRWFVQLMDPRGEALWSSLNAPGDLPNYRALANFDPATHGEIRIVQSRLTTGRFSPFVVRVGASLDFLDEDMARIDRLVARAAGVVLLVAPAVGYWLAGRATRPLAQIIRTTDRLRPDRMDERLTLRHTGDELDRLAETINGLLNRIAEYLARRRDFLANSAHELRTPIAAIRSSAEVALGGRRTSREYEELLADVIDECTSMEVLINQLLLLAETEADHLRTHRQSVDMTSLTRTAVDMFAAVAESRKIDLRADIQLGIVLEGNLHHLRQVLNNLVDNAIKFTPEGGTVEIKLRRDQEGAILLRVTDTGIGISADDLPRIFDRFYRADKSHNREVRGTGLGLSICRAVVEAHGGQISAYSRQGHGSTFTAVFPVAA